MISRVGRGGPLTLGVVLAVIGLYSWTALSSESTPLSRVDPYNRLADAFAHGQTALRVSPDPGLLKLPDPYDPALNAPYRHPDPDYTHDLSLYHGRFYAYWGPSPALVLFLPARLLGADYVPLSVAVLVFAIVAFLAATALLAVLTRRFLPTTPDWMLAAGVALVGLGGGSLFNLRRPAAYEASITAGVAFACVGLLLLVLGLTHMRRRTGLLVAASASFGLAFGARPTMAVLAVALAGALVWLLREGPAPGRHERLRLGAALLGPFTVCVAGYLAYNQARFGSPQEFGLRYQLVDPVPGPPGEQPHLGGYLRPTRIVPATWHYLLAPVRATLQFPYFFLRPPSIDALGTGVSTAEPAVGLLPTCPLLLALPAAPWALRRAARGLRASVAGLAVLGLGAFALVSVLVARLTERYVADFASFLLLAAAICWFAARARLRGRPRRLVDALGLALIAWTAVVTTALSVTGADARLQRLHPATFAALERFFSPLPTAVSGLVGHPVLASAGSDSPVAPSHVNGLGIAGATLHAGPDTPLELRIVSGSRRLAAVSAVLSPGAAIPGDVEMRIEVQGPRGVFSAPVDGGLHELPVALSAGVNRVVLRALPSRRYFSQTDPIEAGQVRLGDVRLR